MNKSKESKAFKEVQRILRKYTCGDDPKDHFVNCCGPDQKPSENQEHIDTEAEKIEPKEIVERFFPNQQEFNENESNDVMSERTDKSVKHVSSVSMLRHWPEYPSY